MKINVKTENMNNNMKKKNLHLKEIISRNNFLQKTFT